MTSILRRGCVLVPVLVVLSSGAPTATFAQSDAVRVSALIGLARVERDAGRFEAAARAFREASRLHAFDEAVLAEFFWTLVEVDQGEAAAIGRRVLAINPGDGDVRDRLIELATRAADEAGALALADEGARVEPTRRDDPTVRAAIARLAQEADRGLARMGELAPEPLGRGSQPSTEK